MNLQQRKILARTVYFMCGLLIIAFLVILFSDSVVNNSSVDKNSSEQQFYFQRVSVGETALFRVNNDIVWVTRLSSIQKDSLKKLNRITVQHKTEGGAQCVILQEYCAINAATKEQGIQLRYTKAPPSQLPAKNIWVGGFVNPSTGAVYDLLGRAYLFQGDVDSLNIMAL